MSKAELKDSFRTPRFGIDWVVLLFLRSSLVLLLRAEAHDGIAAERDRADNRAETNFSIVVKLFLVKKAMSITERELKTSLSNLRSSCRPSLQERRKTNQSK